jgi:integrase
MSGGEAQASWARKLGLEPDTQTCRSRHHGRHTFATEALAAGVSIFELARLMGTSVKVIDRTYGHWRSTPRT